MPSMNSFFGHAISAVPSMNSRSGKTNFQDFRNSRFSDDFRFALAGANLHAFSPYYANEPHAAVTEMNTDVDIDMDIQCHINLNNIID